MTPVDEEVDWTLWERQMARPFRWEDPPARARRVVRRVAVGAIVVGIACLVTLRVMR